jgi:type I restriction enzyme M protein
MTDGRKQLHEKLWSAAEQLRANSGLKLNEMAEPILGLVFLKFADVRFKKAKAMLEAERANPTKRLSPISPDHYQEKGVLYLPEGATYSHLMNLPESENIGKAINEAMKAIEETNRDLAGILPKNYTSISNKTDENSRILLTLLKTFNQIPDDIEGDAFGGIYEYFLGEFARAEGAKGGEFFTAQPIVKLLVEVIEPYHGKIFDPACGSGGMFVQSANFVARHSKGTAQVMHEVTLYGQEKGEGNVRIAKMNLAIHGLSGKVEVANSFYEDVHKNVGKCDFVLANPPFNVKGKDKNKQIIIDPARLHGDPRYVYGLPLTGKGEISNGNYLWMQMFLSALNENGRAGFVMSNAASDAGNQEKELRKKMVDDGIVDVLISVGTNMFMNATLSCALWFFDKRKKGTDRQSKILFINAQDILTEIDRAHNTWTDEQIQEIAAIVRRYRSEEGYGEYKDIIGRCKVASLDEVRANDYSLNPGRYVAIVEQEMDDADFDTRMKELMSEFTSLTAEAHGLEEKIQGDWKKLV